MPKLHPAIALAAIALYPLALPSRAHACGCFTPPDPTVNIVQAGERIVFATSGGQVEAHIQIQYSGDAQDFGWLLPLPAQPTLELGSDELFTELSARTQPDYKIVRDYPKESCYPSYGGADLGSADLGFASDLGAGGPPISPLVVADSIGPYDYAVLKADDEQAMLGWLAANHYFVPTVTDTAVAPYLHPGAFFLALKLRSGKSTGDLQPVVVRYASDLPMIPIGLTAASATPHMGIAVWVLGDARAIPRNYYHVVLDDAAFDWTQGSLGDSYHDLLVRAVAEAPAKHAFVTEYAGPSAIMKNVLDYPGRFGDLAQLASDGDALDYLARLRANGFYFGGALLGILERYFPIPTGAQYIPPAQLYYNASIYAGQFNLQWTFDPAALTQEITTAVVQPTQAAAKLFATYPYLTRLFTTLSPEDMTRDPVFSQNPFLPDVPLAHVATMNLVCAPPPAYVDGKLRTEEGFVVDYGNGYALGTIPVLPGSLRIEILREDGLPEVVTDNGAAIAALLGELPPGQAPPGGPNDKSPLATQGCSLDGRPGLPTGAILSLLAAVAAASLVARRRRR
jgi:hypothetical protein